MRADSPQAEPFITWSAADTRILIIDDDAGSVNNISQVIRDYGSVYFATTGQRGLELAAELRPDLIMLDVEMPGIDGYHVCRELKADAATRGSSIIMVTGHSAVANEVAALEAGAADFVTKPPNIPLVRARVKTQLLVKKQADELQRLVAQDSLTGISNRRAFEEKLAAEWSRHQRQGEALALALVDVDHFKAFNDGYGHQQGDQCLRAVAQTLQQSLRRPGEVVARYGGEEFVVVLPHTQAIDCPGVGAWLCEQVRALAIAHEFSPTAAMVTISVGVASRVPVVGVEYTYLLHLADRALYQAKASGRNRPVVAV